MKKEEILNIKLKLEKLEVNLLAKELGLSADMVRKYKRSPEVYDPPTSKSIIFKRKFGIPIEFWADIKEYIIKDTKKVEEE